MKKSCSKICVSSSRDSGSMAESARGMTPAEFRDFAGANGCDFTLDESEAILWALYARTAEQTTKDRSTFHVYNAGK
ncbi:MAG: hypothetical protein V2A34_05985 [Lentisphaerota bacterium]